MSSSSNITQEEEELLSILNNSLIDNERVVFSHDTTEDILNQMIDILNSFWSRSNSARMISFKNSSISLPINIILLTRNNDNDDNNDDDDDDDFVPVAHSKISAVDDGQEENENSILIESVIVDETKRGFGYGKKIMQLSETLALTKGFNTVYLSTKDAENFYKHLGYEECENHVTCLGASSKFLNKQQLSGLQKIFGMKSQEINKPKEKQTEIWLKKNLN
eukprot:TRINITY_DN355_c0_g9_i1.p1 TRINITY_DN355_c0_g9~~TRINITY_DN355_c0_g9_i1.p1  ORF type:complete len:221 (+),score=69.10 TRINITY_DN355_c0_g9_i1:129-791(+)